MEYTVRIAGTPCETRVSGGTLAEACALLGHPLELVCGGNGRCGKCDVLVERRGVRETVRACITPVTEDITVFLEVSENVSAQILTSGGAHDVFAPAVTKAVLSPAEREPEHCGAYLRGVSLAAARQFSRAHRDTEEEPLTFIRHEDTLLGVQRGDTAQRLYGAAVDIGTTTVAMYIYDLTTGALLHTGSALNGQIRYGADVIARIQHAIEHETGLAELNRAILDTIDALLAAASNDVPGLSDDLWQLVFCGNSTMQHLFLGIDPSALGAEPFASVTADTVRAPAGEIGLKNCPAGALVEFLPLLGGFVGADTTAVLLGVPEEGVHLAVDLGTNGEIVFGNRDFMVSCACSAGPAFEGGDISCGMRATDGAVESVKIDRDTMEPTLGIVGPDGQKPVGICGSGIIDVIAELYRTSIISSKGQFVREGKRVAHDEHGMGRYILATAAESETGREISITEVDIDSFIRAKAAIFSAINIMLSSLDMDVSVLEHVYVAGGIGSGINMENAVRIGMLPDIDRELFEYLGNTSLSGAYAMARSDCAVDKVDELASNMTYLELSTNPRYMDEFVAACFLPHTNRELFPSSIQE